MYGSTSTIAASRSGGRATVSVVSRHDVPLRREILWPYLSNTDWLNRSMGLPPVLYEITPRREGGSEIDGTARFFGLHLRWNELPFEWTEPEFYSVRRVFENGPFIECKIGMTLESRGAATDLALRFEIVPRNFIGRLFATKMFASKVERDMRRIVAHLVEYANGRNVTPLPLPAHAPNEAALQTGLGKLRADGLRGELVDLLEKFIREAPDVELSHIRPLAIARKWGRDPWEVLRLFLHTPRCGLLDLRWEILCPNCRSARSSFSSSLGGLKRRAHCDVCHIEFDAEFDKSVELKFSVNPAIRPVESQTYCLAGPGGRAHVRSQIRLEPHERREWALPETGHLMRLRSAQVSVPLEINEAVLANRGAGWEIECGSAAFVVRRTPGDGPSGGALIHNPNNHFMVVTMEEADWSEDILTASRVTNWQDFRDLFANEVISPDEQVTVGSQVILFTDLRGSTAMYRSLGDPKAYATVRSHFSILIEALRAHHGTLVKTIGDAVMAAFSRVDEALAAVKQMHVELSAASGTLATPLALKSSLHIGPCLIVNANDRLDLFGTSINLAARMVDYCRGGDLVVSEELFRRPEMAAFIRAAVAPPEKTEVNFRGFDSPQTVWRIQLLGTPGNEKT